MKWLLKILITLIIIYIIIKSVFYMLLKHNIIDYSLNGFDIREELTTNIIKNTDNYYFELNNKKEKISFQIFKEYKKNNKIIKHIYTLQTKDYLCILPLFKDGFNTDIMCKNNNELDLYHNIENKDSKMVEFKNKMIKKGYEEKNYQTSKKYNKNGSLYIYKESLPKNHYLAVENYKGLTLINSEIKNITLFEKDVYKKELTVFTGKYYLIADYNNEYSFKKFIVINIVNGKIIEIKAPYEISFNSYIQGVADNEIYIYDKENQKQYKINIEKKYIEIMQDDIIYYEFGKYKTMSLKEAKNNKTFEPYKIAENKETPFKKQGYYYEYKQNKKIDVFRVNIQNQNQKTKYFSTTKKSSVIYLSDYIYYQDENYIKVVNDKLHKKVLMNTEFEFNDSIKFGVYEK